VKVDDKWGYIDPNGRTVIQPQFDSARDFKHARHWSMLPPMNGGISTEAEELPSILNSKYGFRAHDFSEGLAAVYVEDPIRLSVLPMSSKGSEKTTRTGGLISTSFCGRWDSLMETGPLRSHRSSLRHSAFSEGLQQSGCGM